MRQWKLPMTIGVLLLGGLTALQADWSGVASTAAIDEADLHKVILNNDGSAAIRRTVRSTSAKIRLNVTESASLLRLPPTSDQGALEFAMRFRDNGPDARLIATLKQVGLWGFHESATQSTTALATIDSDMYPASDEWQTGRAQWSQIVTSLDFLRYGYVVDVQIVKDNAAGNPGVMGVQVFRDDG